MKKSMRKMISELTPREQEQFRNFIGETLEDLARPDRIRLRRQANARMMAEFGESEDL